MHLPDDLIEMIVKRLTLVDSIRFAAVCPSWRSVSSQWFQRVTRLPWLVKSTKFLDSEIVCYNIYSPSEDTVYNLKFPTESASPVYDCHCSGSVDGWLIMSEWSTERWWGVGTSINYLLNPMTGDRIKLPQLKGIMPHSSTASSDPRSSDCIVAIAKSSEVVFCRPGSHRSWLWKDEHNLDIHFVKFHEDGKLYAIERVVNTNELQIVFLVLDSVLVTGKGQLYEKIIAHGEKTIVAGSSLIANYKLVIYTIPTLTWSSKGDLLLVRTKLFPKGQDKLPEYPITHVFKTDDTSVSNPIWVNVTNDLAVDEALFLSKFHSTLMSKPPKSFMRTIDEYFFSLHCGKFFIHRWNEGTMLDVPRWIWFTPNIIKSR